MDYHYLFMTLWFIAVPLIIAVMFIRKGIHPRPLSIFLGLFLIGQLIGYVINVDILKVAIPHGETGVAYQVITSTAFPLMLAFIIGKIYSLSKKGEQ